MQLLHYTALHIVIFLLTQLVIFFYPNFFSSYLKHVCATRHPKYYETQINIYTLLKRINDGPDSCLVLLFLNRLVNG